MLKQAIQEVQLPIAVASNMRLDITNLEQRKQINSSDVAFHDVLPSVAITQVPVFVDLLVINAD